MISLAGLFTPRSSLKSRELLSRMSAPFNPKTREIRRFLGETGDMGGKLDLSNDWARQVIAAVGNYGEIFERNLTPIGLPRGVNQPWTQGGLLYAMPFR